LSTNPNQQPGPTERTPHTIQNHRELCWLSIAAAGILCLKLAFMLLAIPHLKDQIDPLYGIGHADNYYALAKNVSHGLGLRFQPDTALTLMREPGYPYFLAVFVHEFEDYNRAAIIANMVLTALTAFVIFQLTRMLTPVPWVAVIAPILYMAHPGVLLAELRSGVEILFIFLLLIFLLLLRVALAGQSTAAYIYAGIMLGLTSLVRSTALLFPTFLVLHTLLFKRDWSSILLSALRTMLVLACALLVMTPWIVRNYALVGKFVPTASVQGIALQVGNYLCTHEGGTKSFEDLDHEASDVRNNMAREQGYRFKAYYYQYFYDPHDEVRFNSALGADVLRQYAHSPSIFLKCASENVFNFWFQGKNRAATIRNLVVQSCYLLLALIGVVSGYKAMDKRTLALLVLFVAYTMGVYVPIHAQARYSLSVMPILAILAALPISMLIGSAVRRRSPGQAA
jgi:competence protein ComGC